MPSPMDNKKKPQGMMGALENMQNGLSSSVGITSSKYNSYRDGLGQAIQKAKSSMPYAQLYGSPTPQASMVVPATIYDIKVPTII